MPIGQEKVRAYSAAPGATHGAIACESRNYMYLSISPFTTGYWSLANFLAYETK